MEPLKHKDRLAIANKAFEVIKYFVGYFKLQIALMGDNEI